MSTTPGAQPDSYLVTGAGFTPGASINVFDESGCGGVNRCDGDYVVGRAVATASGSFAASVQLDPTFVPNVGQTNRLLGVTQMDWAGDQLVQRPHVQVPLKHSGSSGVPQPPATGNTLAQSGPAITATPAAVADAYVVSGTGYTPGATVRVIEIRCGVMPCGAGGTAFQSVTVSAQGTFQTTLVLELDDVPTDRDYRLIAAWEGTRGGEATDPQVKVALRHAGSGAGATTTPQPPATGNGELSSAGGEGWPMTGIAAGAALVALVFTLSLATVAGLRRR